MFSRLGFRGNFKVGKSLVVFQQPALSVATTPSDTSKDVENSNKRDLINFPRIPIPKKNPPTRFGFIPDSWFQYFYPKTGVTGPYVFSTGVVIYLFSKEWIVYEADTIYALSVMLAFFGITKLKGPQIRKAMDEIFEKHAEELNMSQEQEKQYYRDAIEQLNNQVDKRLWVKEVIKAKRENVLLQMEALYRERMEEAYKMVKNKLDCQIELDNVEKRIIKRNLLEYVMTNVMKGITPEKEKAVLQDCISQLNNLKV